MKNGFYFRTLLRLREEDKFFRLLKKDKLFEFFIAFLHEVYDEKENKELPEEVFLGLLERFIRKESGVLAENGIEDLKVDNALNLMMSDGYGPLVTRHIFWEASNKGKEASYTLVTTDTYVDAVRLIEERGQFSTIGTNLEIKDTIETVRNIADVISGDVEKQKENLRAKINSLQKELDELEKTGVAKPLSTEEVRQQVFYLRKRVGNITTLLSRGTASFKDECGSYWDNIAKGIEEDDSLSGGAVATKVLNGLNEFLHSEVVKSYEGALELLISQEEQYMLNDCFKRIEKNPEVRKILWEEDINTDVILRKVIRDSKACYQIIHKELSRLNAYMRSGDVERNRLLYKKADEVLLWWKENGKKLPIRYNLFEIPKRVVNIVSPARVKLEYKKPKPKLINTNKITEVMDKKTTSGLATSYRDIRVADISNKFRRLLDKHNGCFTLVDYVKEEGTSLGLYEFLVVRFIMTRYMGTEMVQNSMKALPDTFSVTDYAPKREGLDFNESEISAHSFYFNEEAYERWMKNSFRI